MAQTTAQVAIRAVRDEDFEPIAAIARANFPDTPVTAEEIREQYSRFDPSKIVREWVVAEGSAARVVAYAFFTHTASSFHPDKYHTYAAVHPDAQRRGIGTRLFKHLLRRLGERGATRIKSWAREDYPHAIAFLRGLGFEEYARAFESRLAVDRVDLERFAAYRNRPAEAGVIITTLEEELKRHPACLPAVYQAHWTMDISEPHDDPDLRTPLSYEIFLRDEVRHPTVLLEGFFLAKAGDLYIGESALKRSDADPKVLWQQLTAMLPEFRGRGIATALKLKTLEYAKAHGYREIRTFNSSVNGPMLAINTKLGFVRQPAWVDFIRQEWVQARA